MKKVFKWIVKKICDVSAPPEKTSYIWARRTRSLLATLALWVVWLLRLFSVYQWVKAIYRWLGQTFKFGYVENDSGRPDVPPVLGEIYFVFFLILFSVTHHFNLSSPILTKVSYYYIFESCLWVTYYTVFRRSFELGYTIYHKLEYILTIAIIVPTQALCFSRVYSISFKDTFSSLLGASDNLTPPILLIFSFFLSAIIISIIISTFPSENIKKSIKKAKMIIIGCGDVVKSRLYPALKDSEYSTSIYGYDINETKNFPICKCFKNSDEIKKDCSKFIKQGSVLWIETLPDSHLEYASYAIKNHTGMVVVEKPIAISTDDIEAFEKMAAKPLTRKKLFFLSYYVLEKALPLTFLANISKEGAEKRLKFYKKYLDISGEPLVMCWKQFLGDLKSVKVHITEGEDNRPWVKDNECGGQLFETFLHNILIAVEFCGPAVKYDKKTGQLEEIWKNIEFKNADYSKVVHEISLKAQSQNVAIDLLIKKNDSNKNRTAVLEFENGKITANFDEKSAKIEFTHLKAECTIKVKDEFSSNYSTLVDMVGRVYSKEALPQEVDGFENQTDTLRWLNQLDNK